MSYKIIAIKLITGEEVIGKVDDDAQANIMHKPHTVQIAPMQTPSGDMVLVPRMMPWFASNPDASVALEDSNIIAVVEAIPAVAKIYEQHTSSLDLSATSSTLLS